MESTSSLTRSALNEARAKRTRRLTSLSRRRRRPSRRAPEHRAHPRVAFQSPDAERLLDPDLGLWRDVSDRGLDHRLLPEGRQDLRDVAQERSAWPEDENPVPTEWGMVVEEERSPVEPDRRLAGTRATLHGQQLVEWRADDLVLLSLDGGDDVEHLAGAGPLELGQQRVTPAEPRAAGVGVTASEHVVGDGHDRASVHHDLTSPRETERFLGAGPVEGHGDGCTPVDHDRIGAFVLDMTATDVPGGPVLLVDAPKEQGTGAVLEERDPARQGRDVVEIRVSGRNEVAQKLFGPGTHGRRARSEPDRGSPVRLRPRDPRAGERRSSGAPRRRNTDEIQTRKNPRTSRG